MASGLQSEEERVGVESQRLTTRREHEVDPARLVLTQEHEGGEKEQQQQQRWRHAAGSGLHPGRSGRLAAPGLNCVVDEEAQRQSQEDMGVTDRKGEEECARDKVCASPCDGGACERVCVCWGSVPRLIAHTLAQSRKWLTSSQISHEEVFFFFLSAEDHERKYENSTIR